MNKPRTLLIIPSVSIISGLIAYLVFSGILIQGFNPLQNVLNASQSSSFRYVTRLLDYETGEVSLNMEDYYNSTHLYDFSLKEHQGRKEGSLESATGIYGKCLQWSSGMIIVKDPGIKDVSFTIEAWIYPTSENPISLVGTAAVYPFIQRVSNGSMLYKYSGGTASLFSSQAVRLNAWTHVALVSDFTTGTTTWYINGSERGSRTTGTKNWEGDWSIGRMNRTISTNEWKGKIDEFRVYKGRALTPAEVQEDMNTSIAYKLLLTGVTPNTDYAQLSYPGDELAQLDKLEQYANEEGMIEFNVYAFSGHKPEYAAVLKVIHSGMTYSSPVLSLTWGDVYYFSLNSFFSQTLIAILIACLIAAVPSLVTVVYYYMSRNRKHS